MQRWFRYFAVKEFIDLGPTFSINLPEINEDLLHHKELSEQFETVKNNLVRMPEVLEKIVNGRMNKFYGEVCLTEQEHMIEEGNPKVSKALKQLGLEVKRFDSSFV